jgi:AraC-like DNA-binding protein
MLLKYVTVISCLNSLLLAIALFIKRETNRKARNILSVLLMLMAVYSALIYTHYSLLTYQAYQMLKWYIPIDGLFLLLMGPCLYFYVLSVLQHPFMLFDWRSLLHIIPLLPCAIFNINFCNYAYTQRIEWLVRDFHIGTPEMSFLNIVLYLQMLAYLLICYSLVKKQLMVSNRIISGNSQIDISWLKTFLLINLVYIILSAPLCFYFENEQTNIIIGQLGIDIQFLYMFFKYILKHDVSEYRAENAEKDSNFKIHDTVADEYMIKLLAYMETHKPYCQADCSIHTLAEQTGIPVHHLSITLNNRLKKTFPDFVNKCRVEEAQRLLCDPASQQRTIESIGIDCGFGSKSTFNRAFLKHNVNMTPTEYRKNCSQCRSAQSKAV